MRGVPLPRVMKGNGAADVQRSYPIRHSLPRENAKTWKCVQTNMWMGLSLVFRYAFAVNLYLDPWTPPANGGSDCDLWTSDCDFGALGAGNYSLMILGRKPSRRSFLDLKRWWLIDPLASWSAAKMENIFCVCIDILHKNRRTIIICFVIKMILYVYCMCVCDSW